MAVVLIIATEWEPSKGGLSACNQELAAALARVGHDVHCVVPEATRAEVAGAGAQRVRLHSAFDRGVLDGSPFPVGVTPDVIIGHDRPSGPDAARWHARYGAARWVHLFHVHPAQIDGLKSDKSILERGPRLEAAMDLARRADAVFAVGPLLAGWWAAELGGRKVETLLPGLPELLPAAPSPRSAHPRVLLVGRAEDAELKGLFLAGEVLSQVTERHPTMEFRVRGVTQADVLALERRLRETYPKPARLTPLQFTADRSRVAADLTGAWLVLQPSLEEGFGLVALEALALETPVLVTARSGVGAIFQQIAPELARHVVIEPTDPDRWAAAVHAALADPDAARARALALAAAYRAAYTWDAAARALVDIALASSSRPSESQRRSVRDQLLDASASLRRVPRTIDGNWIKRPEETSVERWLGRTDPDPSASLLLLVGAPGTGKSALLGTIVDRAEEAGTPVLGIKADYLTRAVRDMDALRAFLRLDEPVIDTLSRAAHEHGSVLLVVDQLDALCELVDPDKRRLNVLLQLIGAAASVPGVRVIASVREFELQHEARLRAMERRAERVRLPELAPDDFKAALADLTLPVPLVPALATPHALDLIVAVRRLQPAGFAFPGSVGQLREDFWRLVVEGRPEREEAALAIASALEGTGSLWIEPPSANVDVDVCDVLVRRGLLLRTPDQRVGFRHQTLFDLARSRKLVATGAVAEFVLGNQAQLSVRPLVRSTLMHVREANPSTYGALVDHLWNQADLALHVRLLLVDTIADTAVPTAFEERALARAVEDPRTRRRALASLALHRGWFDPLQPRIERWMTEYPAEIRPVVASLLDATPARAVDLLKRLWVPTEVGARRTIDVLASARSLGSEVDPLLEVLVDEITKDSRYVLPGIGSAVEAADAVRAANLYARCIVAEATVVAGGGTASGELGATDALAKLDVPIEPLLDQIEPAGRRIIELGRARFERRLGDCEDSLRDVIQRLLQKLGRIDPARLLLRAGQLPSGDALEPIYAAALGALQGHVSARARWLAQTPSRLEHDPDSALLLRIVAPHLDMTDTRALDAAIDHADDIRVREDHDAADRREIGKHNRAYRVFLRSLLPQEHREGSRRVFDERELFQVPAFHPTRAFRAGVVRSPMSPAQLGMATNADVLKALAQRGHGTRFSESEDPVGDGRQALGAVGELAANDPEKVASIVWDLRKAGRLEEARNLVDHVAKHLDDAAEAQELALALFGQPGTPLAEDDPCATALETVAERAGLLPATIERVLGRLEAAATLPIDHGGDDAADEGERCAIFGAGLSGMVLPRGAFSWLACLAANWGRGEVPDHELWARAVRAALRADPRPESWLAILDRYDEPWAWLAGPASLQLLREIEGTVRGDDIDFALTRVYAPYRTYFGSDAVEEFVDRLVDRGACVNAAELATLIASDGDSAWAKTRLDAWRAASTGALFARGVLAGVGALFGKVDRRKLLGELAVEWIPVAPSSELGLLFSTPGEAWSADTHAVRVLVTLVDRVAELDRDTLGNLVLVLERFVDPEPDLVARVIDAVLSRALALDDPGVQPVIAEVLALTYALRIRSPELSDRLHAIFERALQADSLAAAESLDIVDGRAQVRVFGRRLWPRPTRPPRRRRTRRKR